MTSVRRARRKLDTIERYQDRYGLVAMWPWQAAGSYCRWFRRWQAAYRRQARP